MGKPTEELRARLDERGIKYNVLNQDGLETVTYFDLPDGREVGYTEFSSGNTQLRIWNETPEQAITATVGAGTCHIIEDEDTGYLTCSECGAIQPDDYTVYHCWCCGKKIKED